METRPRSSPGPRYPGFNSAILACTTSRRWLQGFSLMKLAAQRRVTPQALGARGSPQRWPPLEILEDSEDLAGNFPIQNGANIFGRSVGNCEICWRYCRDIFSDDLVVGCLLPEKARILIHNDSLPSNIFWVTEIGGLVEF